MEKVDREYEERKREMKTVDELLIERAEARLNKDFKRSDEIRSYLDSMLIFIFDTKDNDGKPFQEVHYLHDKYFDNMEKIENIINYKFKNKRDFVEYKIKEDIKAEAYLEAWLYTMMSKTKGKMMPEDDEQFKKEFKEDLVLYKKTKKRNV